MNWRKGVETLGLILAVLALVVGVFHVWEIQQTAKDLHSVQSSLSHDLRSIQSSLSTRFAGEFPDFLDQSIRTVRSAQHDVVILCDFPFYGDFSDPRRALLLRQAIEEKLQQGITVQLIFLSEARRIKALRE